jgi:spermidine dehydrogenase
MSFESFERETRDELARALGGGGFDAARDIAAITVNRWPHGYAQGQNVLEDPDWTETERPWVVGRAQFGRISIANSDAAATPLTQAAINQGHRAVEEVLRTRTSSSPRELARF